MIVQVEQILWMLYFIASIAADPIEVEVAHFSTEPVQPGESGYVRNNITGGSFFEGQKMAVWSSTEHEWIEVKVVRTSGGGFVQVSYRPPATIKPGIYTVAVKLWDPRGDDASWLNNTSFKVDIDVVAKD